MFLCRSGVAGAAGQIFERLCYAGCADSCSWLCNAACPAQHVVGNFGKGGVVVCAYAGRYGVTRQRIPDGSYAAIAIVLVVG